MRIQMSRVRVRLNRIVDWVEVGLPERCSGRIKRVSGRKQAQRSCPKRADRRCDGTEAVAAEKEEEAQKIGLPKWGGKESAWEVDQKERTLR